MKVHFIAIAGTGMGALARLLVEAGHEVRGSDTAIYPPMSEQLARAQIPVMIGFGADNLAWGPDCVVVGNVCSKDHPEVKAAPPNYPANAEQMMVKNDLDWMARERERILKEWTRRYDGKSAPKN